MTWSLKKALRSRILSSSLVRKVAPYFIEQLKSRRIVDEFRIGRVSAAASAAIGKNVDEFWHKLGASHRVPRSMRGRIQKAMKGFEPAWRAWNETVIRSESVCWDSAAVCSLSENARLKLYHERRAMSEARLRPLEHFGFLVNRRFVPAIKFNTRNPNIINIVRTDAKNAAFFP